MGTRRQGYLRNRNGGRSKNAENKWDFLGKFRDFSQTHSPRHTYDKAAPLDLRHRATSSWDLRVGHRVDVGTHHAYFVIFLIQIMQQDVPERHHADQVSFVADREVAETVAPHQRHTVLDLFIHADAERIVGHDLSHAGITGIAAFGDNALHEVALRKNSDELTVVQDGHGTDAAFDHGPHGLEHGVPQFRLICVLILNQVADTHLTPPGLQIPSCPKSIYRAVSI